MSARGGLPSHWVRRIVLAAIVAAALYAVFAALNDGAALRGALSGFRWWTAGAALALVSAGYLFRAARWRMYLDAVGAPTTRGFAFLTFLSGFAMGVTPGKMGEVVKAYFVRERVGASYDATIPAVVAERVTDMVAVALLLGAGLAFVPRGVGFGVAVVVLVASGLVLLRSERAADIVLRLVAKARWARRLEPRLRAMHAHVRPLLSGRRLLVASLLALASWTLEVWAMWLLARGFGVELSWGACAFVFTITLVAGVASLLPGGLGVTEGGMVVLLGTLGVDAGAGTAITLATRLCSLWWGVLVGLVAVGLLQRAPRAATKG